MNTAALSLIISIFSLIMLSACGTEPEAIPAQHAPSATNEHAPDHSLVLNHGKKWQTDAHTRDAFVIMTGRFVDVDINSASATQLKTIGDHLNSDIDALVEGCSMKGDAHTQLHVYLNVYLPAIDALVKKPNPDSAQDVVHILAVYNDYFE